MALATGLFFFICLYVTLEFIYLKSTASLYKTHFASVLGVSEQKVRVQLWPYGIVCYALLFVVIWHFVIRDIFLHPVVDVKRVLMNATLFALAIYGVYNLTNLATLGTGYSPVMALMDTAWGVLVINTVAISCIVFKKTLAN